MIAIAVAASATSANVQTRESDQQPTALHRERIGPLLNSERIERKFGNYGIQVIEHSSRIRVSNLYSATVSGKTTRTLAIVFYPTKIHPPFADEHRKIVVGGSIGSVFKDKGWSISKKHRYFGEISSSPEYRGLYQMMGGIEPSNLTVHVYDFNISKEGEEFKYATISEIHHPDYLGLDEVEVIYDEEQDARTVDSMDLQPILRTVYEKIKGL